jgi:hypothetical protein
MLAMGQQPRKILTKGGNRCARQDWQTKALTQILLQKGAPTLTRCSQKNVRRKGDALAPRTPSLSYELVAERR